MRERRPWRQRVHATIRWGRSLGWWDVALRVIALGVGALALVDLLSGLSASPKLVTWMVFLVTAAALWWWRLPGVGWGAALALTTVAPADSLAWVLAALLAQVSLATLIVRWTARRAVVMALVTAAVLYLRIAITSGAWAASLSVVAWTAAVAGLAFAVRSRREYVREVRDRAERTIREREVRAGRQMAEERLRIARELHDVIGHQLAVVNLHAGLAQRLIHRDPAGAETAIVGTRQAAHDALRELGAAVRLLRRPGDEAWSSPSPSVADLRQLVDSFTRGGLRVEMTVTGDTSAVDPTAGLTTYRVVQEALTNAQKHGRGSATVSLGIGDTELVVSVDNPVVPGERPHPDQSPPVGGWGLIGMAERVRALRGELSVVEHPGGRYELRAVVPLHAPLGARPPAPGHDGVGPSSEEGTA